MNTSQSHFAWLKPYSPALSPYLCALLAHALWSFNSSGLRIHRLLQLFTEPRVIVLLFPGRFLTSIVWCRYERNQVYQADA